MMAVALCGTAFALDTNDYNDGDDFYSYYSYTTTLNVNKTVAFSSFKNEKVTTTTLTFVGDNTFSATDYFGFDSSTTAIMGDSTAATHWESKLFTATDTAVIITLATAPNTGGLISLGSITFMGASKNGSVTLGNTELTYVGYLLPEWFGGMDALKASLQDNQVALVEGSGADKGLYLVGKATPTTPEPATATLSLLALAGMASRRRRK